MLEKELQRLADTIRIGLPFQEWMEPRFHFDYDIERNIIRFIIRIRSPNALSNGEDKVEVQLPSTWDKYEALYLAKHPEAFYKKVFSTLLEIIEHELKESFYTNGEYFIDPHPNR